MALVSIKDIKQLKNKNQKNEKRIEFYKEVLKNLELFLTFWYEHTSEFGKIKDEFNQHDGFDCEIRVKDGRVKIKMNTNNEKNSSTN
jgi:hypothetical protein